MNRPRLAALAGLALAVSLGGCVSLFPKAEPAQLYRFGDAAQPAQASGGPGFTVLLDTLSFDKAADTDRILTSDGNQLAYVKGGRWASPASVLFQAAVLKGFDAPGAAVRLIQRGESARAQDVLKLSVVRFEARYDHGAGAAPTVSVVVRAALNRQGDYALLGAQTFDAEVPASDNRIGPIADAFDKATAKVVGDVAQWVGQTGGR